MKIHDLLNLFQRKDKKMTMEEVFELTQMRSLEDCKRYMRVMLDFYFKVIQSPEGRKCRSAMDDDRNIWLQQMFSMGCHFLSLLDGVGYRKGIDHLNPIVDPDVLFTVGRRMYESVVVFDTLFILPKDEDHQTILYNLFMAHGLSERLKDLDEDMINRHPERVASEEADIAACKEAIETCPLYNRFDNQTKKQIDYIFGKKFRYMITDELKFEPVEFDKAYQQLGVKEELFQSLYSFFSLHGHPSYLSVCQFRDAFKPEFRADWMMAQHATQCALSFMSIFIVDYMKLNPEVKATYDKMEEPRRFAIGMYEDAMRGEHKFK